jgi:hypothetical protein
MAGKAQNDPHLDYQIADALATGLERFAERLKGLRKDETVPDTAAAVGGIFGHRLVGLAAEIRDDAAQLRDAHISNAERHAAAERAAERPPIDTKGSK